MMKIPEATAEWLFAKFRYKDAMGFVCERGAAIPAEAQFILWWETGREPMILKPDEMIRGDVAMKVTTHDPRFTYYGEEIKLEDVTVKLPEAAPLEFDAELLREYLPENW